MVNWRAVWILAFASIGGLGCHAKQRVPGQLIIAIDTDMALPDQIDTVELQIVIQGVTVLDNPMPVGAGVLDTQPIPATLTLVAGPDPTLPVTIRVLGIKGSTTRTLRQVITTIPQDRIATLRMPVQWLCDGTAQAVTLPDGGVGYESSCGPDATCKAGRCVESMAQPTDLEDYQPQAIFGGGPAPTAGGTTTGTCFDTIPCMVGGNLEVPDDQCTIDAPAGDQGNVNVALRIANDGICDTTGTTCFVPLDGDSSEGWTGSAGRIALPTSVCTKLRTGLVAGVVTSTSCPTKTDAIPPCGAWSSVAPAVDAAAPKGDAMASTPVPVLVSSTISSGGATSICCPLTADSNKLYTCSCTGSNVQVLSIDPSAGTTTVATTLAPQSQRTQYAGVLAGGSLFWADRTTGPGGDTCPIHASPTNGAMASTLAVIRGDIYDGADLLADAGAIYALADNVSGLSATASPVQALRIDRAAGTITTYDTGGNLPVLQFTQDMSALYVGVDTDVAVGGGVERVSRIARVAKTGGAVSTLFERTIMTSDPSHGGFIGLQSDGTTLFALFEAGGPGADGTIDTQVLTVDGSGNTAMLYQESVDPTVVRLRLLGAVDGAILLVRDGTYRPDGGMVASSLDSTVLVVPAGGGAPRIVASFSHDSPVFELQAPVFSPDVFWINSSGRVFRLPAAGLK